MGTRPGTSDYGSLAFWAADCAERALPLFEEKRPKDDRPRKAIEAARAWAQGVMTFSGVRAAALAAHAAARAAVRAPTACAAARSAGHAAATAHVATHAAHAAAYAVKAVTAAAGDARTAAEERSWQIRRLPKRLRPAAFPAGKGGP
jgi:hypothetical protein